MNLNVFNAVDTNTRGCIVCPTGGSKDLSVYDHTDQGMWHMVSSTRDLFIAYIKSNI